MKPRQQGGLERAASLRPISVRVRAAAGSVPPAGSKMLRCPASHQVLFFTAVPVHPVTIVAAAGGGQT
jgi:hypothetical protein